MQPNREDQQKSLESNGEKRPNRFRIIKLEERIAPNKGGNTNKHGCPSVVCTQGCSAINLSCQCTYNFCTNACG